MRLCEIAHVQWRRCELFDTARYAILRRLTWVVQTEGHKRVVALLYSITVVLLCCRYCHVAFGSWSTNQSEKCTGMESNVRSY